MGPATTACPPSDTVTCWTMTRCVSFGDRRSCTRGEVTAPAGEYFEMKDEPHTRILCERLVLANALPRCGARRDGEPCRGAAMANGRCRMHGGPSTGPRTPEGLERSRRSNWKHGHYSAKAKQVRREARQQYRLLRQLIAAGNEDDVLDLISSM